MHSNKEKGHGHSHSHDKEKKKEKGHGHSHSHDKEKKKEKGHGHSHSHDKEENKEKGHGHSHSHEHGGLDDHDDHDEHDEDEGGWDSKLVSFVVIGVLTFIYVIGELAVGLWLHSLVLLSDGFHNLSDVISLYIAYWAQSALKRGSSDDMSYGWARTEILGGLTNGCILLSLCLYVILESIPKFIQPLPMEGGLYFMIVAGAGLAVNLIGTLTFLFTGHGHTHAGGGGGHSHSHGGHSHGGHSSHDSNLEIEEESGGMDMNVKAVFLHYLGDTVSSLLVLIAGLLLYLSNKEGWGGKWTHYIDPVSSLIIVALILFTTIPLVKRCSMILLQSTPENIDVDSLRQKISRVEGIMGIHDFHLWMLVDGMLITSLHLAIEEGADFYLIVKQVKSILHKAGVHSSTIQPEFTPVTSDSSAPYCQQNCTPECSEDWCCKKQKKSHQKLQSQFRIDNELP